MESLIRRGATGVTREGIASLRSRIDAIFEASTDAIIIKDLDGIITDWNPGAERLYGYTAAEAIGRSILILAPPGRAHEIERLLERVRTGESITDLEAQRQRKDGSLVHVSLSFAPIRDQSGRLLGTSVIARDNTARVAAWELMNAQRQILERIVQDGPLLDLLEGIVRTIEAHARRPIRASILLLDQDGLHLRHGAAPSLPDAYSAAIDGLPIGPVAGSCGTAAYLRVPVVVEDIATDPRWAEFRALALPHGLRACWSTPILGADGSVLGTFALYYPTPTTPQPDERHVVDLLTRTAAIAIERAKSQGERERLLLSERAARAEADDARRHYLDLVQGVDAIVWEADANTFAFTFVSKRAEEVLGYPVEQWLSEPHFWAEHIHPEDRSWAVDFCVRCTAAAQDHQFEYRIIDASGNTVWLRDIVHVVTDENNEPVTLRGVMVDITDVKRAEEERERLLAQEQAARAEAENALRVREALVSFATHDLRTPLTMLKGQAQMLTRMAERGRLAPELLTAGLASIDSATVKMESLITELLDTVRLQAGQQLDLRVRPIDLVALARRCAEDAQRSTDKHTVTLDAALPDLTVDCDPARIERVLGNLLSNAVKYSPNGGPVTVRVACVTSDGRSSATVAVEDAGLGIPAADLPRVFERFHRAANVAGRIDGSGIGLAGAKQIVEQHGGALTVTSTEGSGSTFTIHLPLPSPTA